MKIIGLTGGIGSGKTTVAAMFTDLGIPVYIADQRARELTNSSEAIIDGIKKLLGKEAYVDGSLDRAFVSEQVFNDKELLDALNAIIHPEVGRDFTIWCDKQQSPYVIKEAAILFESGSYLGCDQVILVTADLEMRIERIIRRDGTDREHILARMSNQWSDQRKSELADFIIENNDLASTRAQVEQIHAQLLQAAQ